MVFQQVGRVGEGQGASRAVLGSPGVSLAQGGSSDALPRHKAGTRGAVWRTVAEL